MGTTKVHAVMEFLVQFELNIPEGTPESEVDERVSAEAAASAALAREGHLERLWRPPVAPGERMAIGLYGAENRPQLDGLLAALPLSEWMQVSVTPLEPHSNDPNEHQHPKETHMSVTTQPPPAGGTGAQPDDTTLVESAATAIINAPIESIDIPSWCFSLRDDEYQACSPAHVAGAATTAPDGRRMSLNVEVIGGSLIVQHYVEEIGDPDHLRLVSHSDLFTPSGRTKIDIMWDLRVRQLDDRSCEFTNTVRSSAPPEMIDFLARQGLAIDAFRAARRPNTEAHNRQETPMFAKSIERHALGRR
jgi:muconolactone delta-isomerase